MDALEGPDGVGRHLVHGVVGFLAGEGAGFEGGGGLVGCGGDKRGDGEEAAGVDAVGGEVWGG